jgi:Na+/H+ antiporter NhaD/arsenite permease-like protein
MTWGNPMKKVLAYLYKDKVFVVALIFAIGSMFFIAPSLDYLDYINYKVLIIMFTLMLAVAGIYETHFFDFVATKLVLHFRSIKWIGLVIIIVTFFLGMLLTNDAVLLTLVPFTIFITKHTKKEKYAVMIIILQTIAANMGSALTPMGDPQNIYLYAFYDIPFKDFLMTTAVVTLSGFFLVTVTAIIKIPHQACELNIVAPTVNWKRFALYMLIMANALLSVLRVLPETYTILITMILAMIYGRHLFKRVDYTLLLTFTSFFIFTGNLGQITWIKDSISHLLDSRLSVFFTGLITSQFISNVPAAVLLSTFTDRAYWQPLLQGVNIGAMGTIIGSLASLITFKYVMREYRSEAKTYLKSYTIISIIFIAIISTLTLLITI